MASLKQQFEAAAKHFESIVSSTSDKQKLRLYALWNQAVNGDVDIKDAPPATQFVKRAKFEARKKVMGMTAEMAMKRYISELRALDPDWKVGAEEGLTTTSAALAATPPPSPGDGGSKPSRASVGALLSPKNLVKKATSGGGSPAGRGAAAEAEFAKACEYALKSKVFANSNSRILLYSYYKQATAGPCREPAPRQAFNRRRYNRWRAWANLFEMSKEDAMAHYVAHVKRFAPNFSSGVVPASEMWAGDADAEEGEEGAGPAAGPTAAGPAAGAGVAAATVPVTRTSLSARVAAAAKGGGQVYLVTGASGFLGTFLVGELLKRHRDSLVLAVTRGSSIAKMRQAFAQRYGASEAARVLPLPGDVSKPQLGLDKELVRALLESKVLHHFFHLAASYDMAASEAENQRANVEGTANAVGLANELGKACGTHFQYCSSIVVAGQFHGMFLESMLEEGQDFDNPYARTKYEAEVLVRRRCTSAFRVYRPGIVVGHSETGEAVKIDGPYYFFKPIQQMRKYLPSSLTLPCIEGSTMPLVPVDYVVKAMDAIAHAPGAALDKRAFHLVDSSPPSFIEVLNILARAAGAPTFSSRLVTFLNALVPARLWNTVGDIKILAGAPGFVAQNVFKIPESVVGYISMQCEWDDSDAREVLADSGLRCPRFGSYAWRLWDYWVRFMDRSLDKKKALRDEVSGKTVLITGSSDGIGLTLAKRLAKENAHVILVARNLDKLREVKREVEAEGGSASVYAADLSEEASTNAMIAAVIKDHGDIDVLVNNAGRSIRRSVEYQYDRFHDFSRTIDLNYYGSLRCILGFLPNMRKRKAGQIINISSIGCITNAPRFGAYVASKAALDAFSRVISSEVDGDNIVISTVYMGLVATKMVVSKGNEYDRSDLLTTEQASEMIERAIVTKERRVDTDVGRWVSIAYFLFPSLTESLLHLTYSLEPEAPPQGALESAKASGDKAQLKAVRNLMRGAF